MRLRHSILTFVIAVFLASFAAAQAGPSEIRIGVISGLTGMAGKWNRFQNMGILLAKEELERSGMKIKLITEDSRSLSPSAIAAFNKLLEYDHVDGILADDFGFVLAPILPLVRQRHAFLVALSLPHDRYCAQAEGDFYSAASQFADSRPAFQRFFELHPEVKRVALIIFDDPEWGRTYQDVWTKTAAAAGAEIVDQFINSEANPDYKSGLSRMLSKHPDAIFIAHEPEGFFKALAQLKFKGPIVTANNVLEMLADSPEPRPELEGVFVADPEISDAFRKKFVARFGRQPILEAYAGYDALRAMARAFTAQREYPASGMKTVAFDGVAGRIDFTRKSCAGNHAGWGLYRFHDGAMVRQ